MEPDQLSSGDKVIPLASLVVTAAVVAGGINSAVVAWTFGARYSFILGYVIVGAIVCGVSAKFTANIVFPANVEGHVFVVQAGPSALPLTLKAAFAGSILALLLSGLGFALLIGGQTLVNSTWLIVGLASVAVAMVWGVLAALL